MNEEWQLRRVRVPQGTHFSNSKVTPGAERELLREDGTNKILGPPESFPVDEDVIYRVYAYETDSPRRTNRRELSPAQQVVADAIADVLETVVREAVIPVVKEVIAPAIKRKLIGIAKRPRSTARAANRQFGTTGGVAVTAAASTDYSNEVDAVVEEPCVSMSSTEFRERFIAALAADAFAAEQKRILSNARIEDDDLSRELKSATKLALAGNAYLLDEEALAVVAEILGISRTADGEYVLLRGKEIKDAPRLTNDET